MSAGAGHLEGLVPVLEEEQGAPLCNLAGPKFTHGFQVSLVESFVESLHQRGTHNVQKPITQNGKKCFRMVRIRTVFLANILTSFFHKTHNISQ